jgi:hypothetical protein
MLEYIITNLIKIKKIGQTGMDYFQKAAKKLQHIY